LDYYNHGVRFACEEGEEEARGSVLVVTVGERETKDGDQYGQQVGGDDSDPESIAGYLLKLLVQDENQTDKNVYRYSLL